VVGEGAGTAGPRRRRRTYLATKVEILYFDGCPSYREAQATLEEILSQGDVTAEVRPVAVDTDEEVQRLRFPGSPTIRVDGEDLFPVPDRTEYGARGIQGLFQAPKAHAPALKLPHQVDQFP